MEVMSISTEKKKHTECLKNLEKFNKISRI